MTNETNHGQTPNERLSPGDFLKKTISQLGFDLTKLDFLDSMIAGANQEKFPTLIIGYSALVNNPLSKPDDPLSQDGVNYELHLSRDTKDLDRYFLNSYEVAISSPLWTKPGEKYNSLDKRTNIVPIYEGWGFTAKESYNMLSQRWVLKNFKTREGQKYSAYAALDFKTPKDDKGKMATIRIPLHTLNIADALGKYPIKKLSNPEHKQALVDSLKRGNLQKAQLTTGQTVYIATDPPNNGFRFYDKDLQQRHLEPLGNQKQVKTAADNTDIEKRTTANEKVVKVRR